MSGIGAPGGDSFVKDRFLAGRSAANNGIDPEVLQLAEGGGGAQAVSPPASPSAGQGAPPSAGQSSLDPSLPLGLRVEQWSSNYIRDQGAKQQAEIAAQPKTMGEAFTGAVGGAWDALKNDFLSATGQGRTPEEAKAFTNAPFWETAKQVFHQQMSFGKLPVDAFNLALSPLSGVASAGTEGIDKAVHGVLPFVPSGATKAALDQAMIGIGPEGGKLAVAKAAAAESGEGAAAAKPGAAAAEAPKPGLAAQDAPKPSGEGLETQEPPFRVFDLGDEDKGPKINPTPAIRAQAADFLAGKRADNPIQVSLEGLSRSEDLNETIADMARFIPKGAVKPDDIRDMGAYALNLSPDEVMARLKPQFPTDELQGAAAMAVSSAGEQFQKFARSYMENPTPENRELAVRAYAQANEFIGKFRDAGTDLGRGLRARQSAWDARDDMSQAIHQAVTDVGPDNVDEAIRKVAGLPDAKTAAPFVSSLRWMGGRDGLLFGWYNWLLSNPATVVKKITSDATVGIWNTATRYAAEKLSNSRFGSGDVRPGEAAALYHGYVGSMRDGLSAAAKALKEGQSQFWGDYQTMDGRTVEASGNHQPGAIPLDAPSQGAVAWWRSALPTSWIGAADDFAKVVNYRAEVHALAYRDAMIKGLSDENDIADHMAKLTSNVPQHIHYQAVNAALRNTFQEPLTGIAEKLQDIADGANIPVPGTSMSIPFGRVVMPFVKVPANIAKFAYRNSPLAAAFPSAAVKAELTAGGATRDMALARMGMGTAVSLAVLPWVIGGNMTGRGPSDPQLNRAWQAAGNKPYSIKVGDKWVGYNRVEPLAMHLSALADTIGTIKYARDEDAESLAWSMVFGVGDAMLSKTYMSGVSDFLNALHDPQGEGKYYGDRLAAAMTVPQGVAGFAAASDPWLRQHYNFLDAVEARTPGLASGLPPVRDLWGQAVPHDTGFAPPPAMSGTVMSNWLSPVQMAPSDKAQPIDKWIWGNREAFPDAENGRLGITRPGQTQTFEKPGGGMSTSVKLTPQQLDRLRVLAGNELKDPRTGMGARDALNALVNGNSPDYATQRRWDKSSPAAKALIVLREWNAYRDKAKLQLLSEDKDLQATLGAAFDTRTQALKAPAKAPTIGAGL